MYGCLRQVAVRYVVRLTADADDTRPRERGLKNIEPISMRE
jgi:hypothetical protein